MTNTGRPSEYTEEMAIRICELVADGKSVKDIGETEGFPVRSTIYKWLGEQTAFSAMYARAREERADLLADEIIEISDDARNDWMKSNDPDNEAFIVNGEHIQRSRLRVDSRKWAAAKLNPKRYGDKLTHAGDAESPVKHVHEVRRTYVRPEG